MTPELAAVVPRSNRGEAAQVSSLPGHRLARGWVHQLCLGIVSQGAQDAITVESTAAGAGPAL